jgi:exodeoxyribonuclease V beta subunit
MNELDVFTCALDGVNQIEASAGTGKTWNLCALYMRLLLEKKLRVEQILVVTFTKAATAELQERIRNRLGGLLRAIELRLAANPANPASHDEPGDDAFISGLFATTLASCGHDELEATAKQLRVALRSFDQAAIHTIHGFCQHALQDASFGAALPFTLELQEEDDDNALRLELAADFWREQVEPVAACFPDFARWLVENNAQPSVLSEQLSARQKKPLAQLRWMALDVDEEDLDGRAQRQFDEARALWQAERDAIRVILDEAMASSLNRNLYKPPEIIDVAIRAWDDWFAQGNVYAPLAGDKPGKLAASALKKATKARCETPVHDFFILADALVATVDTLALRQKSRWLRLMRLWLEQAPHELAKRKQERRVMSFYDQLANLYYALAAHPWLAGTLRMHYGAALIDEFQDTDPLQFDIFSRLFVPGGPLFLMGDPKQAIYRFRGADLHTYLAARHVASANHTLAVNQRSTPQMIDACNRIFGANPRAFMLDGLDYQPVRASDRPRAPFVDEARGTGENANANPGELIVWTLPDGSDDKGSGILKKDDAQRAASAACAAEIVRLLRGAREGRVKIGDAPLAPAQIAVLVYSNRQGALIKKTLAKWGVGSVETTKDSVFHTEDARQMECVLVAINTPGDLRCLRTAMATDWFALDAQALWQSAQPDVDVNADVDADTNTNINININTDTDVRDTPHAMSETQWIERFVHYRALWHEHGFAVMWHTLADELRIAQWLAAQPDGERRLTNVSHLAELLQDHDVAQPGLAPTLRWLATQRQSTRREAREQAQLRLESDRDLVQITTVHRAKGLEYAVVFCPFLNEDSRDKPPSRFGAREYHDDDGHTVLHYGLSSNDDRDVPGSAERAADAKRREKGELAAERVRLLYVALTRAVYRCHVVAGPYLAGKGSPKESQRSMLNWLVAGNGYTPGQWLEGKEPAIGVAELSARWRAFAGGPVSLRALPLDLPVQRLASAEATGRAFDARIARRALYATWRISSFSAMTAAAHASDMRLDARPGHGARVGSVWGNAAPEDEMPTLSDAPRANEITAPDDILFFPRGAASGECLHRMFELANFADRTTWPAAIECALRERPVNASGDIVPRLPAMMQRLLAEVSATELAPQSAPGMTLATLDPARRLTELAFMFPAAALNFDALRRVLRTHGYPDVMLEPGILNGFVKGFIDMVFEHDGRYWIIDWKSNDLGHTAAHYDAPSLERAMTTHAYHLQALLYMVALHRYLRARVPGYDYDTHCGGYLYLFVRGVRAAWQATGNAAGIHMRRPDRALIETLDRLMNEKAA